MKKSILLIVLIFASIFVFGQVEQPNRIEFEDKEYENYQAFSLGEKGALVLSKNEVSRKVYDYQFQLLSTNLKVIKTVNKQISKNHTKITTYKDSLNLYILAQDVKKGTFEFFTINISPFRIKKITGTLLKKSSFNEMIVLNNYAYLPISVKRRSIIQVINLKNGNSKNYFPEVELGIKSLGFESMQITGEGKRQELLMTYFSCTKKSCQYSVYQFNRDSKKVGKPILIESQDEKAFTSLTLSKISNGYVMSGTYSDKRTGSSQGMYFGKITKSGQIQYVNHYNFLEFTNFLSYLSEKKQAKIEKKKKRKEKKGKELTINYRVTIHEIIEHQNEYILVGEFYYPTYRTETYTTVVNGQSVTRTRQVFDGYQYSHAVIASFNQKGQMSWSNSFEMWVSNKPFYVKQFITISANNEQIGLIYATSSLIKSVAYKNGKEVVSRNVDFVNTGNEKDKIKYTVNSEISYWYADNYISWGYQKIKTEKKGRDKRRKVYYINKVSFGNSENTDFPKRSMNNSDF